MSKDHGAALTALSRFGFGARPGDLDAASGDPRGYLLAELGTPNVALVQPAGLSSCAASLQAVYLDQQRIRAERAKLATANETQPAVAAQASLTSGAPIQQTSPQAAGAMSAIREMKAAPAQKPPAVEQALFRAEAQARFAKQTQAQAGLVERLVVFWSNHFAVSAAKSNVVRAAAGPFEREAIRPNAIGRFATLLVAAESHPAMILFLDNQRSIGPNAPAGRFAGDGLNENLGREILELHTLGAGGGYSQADVTELARALTGWSVGGPESEIGQPGAFLFKPNWHEPGERALLSKHYAPGGFEQAREALEDLARHPSTAKHIATKLARHFVADDPAPDLVASLASKFRDTDGDLKAVAEALVTDDRAWSAKPAKLRTPLEFTVAAARAARFAPPDPGPYLQALNMLGQPLWQPTGPNGFSDLSDAWASPEAMKLRLDLAANMASRMRGAADPRDTLAAALGEAASPETRQAVERAESREQALALLFMAPEFQRR